MISGLFIAAVVLSFMLFACGSIYQQTVFETPLKQLIAMIGLIILAFATIVCDLYALGIILILCL